jgi:hypothetical protein
MGLDQYAYLRNKDSKLNGTITDEDYSNIKYEWRKHARLQVFMRDLHREKNPDAHKGNFGLGFNNESSLELTVEDLEKLEKAIKEDYYGCFASDGFFWGQQFQEESAKEYKDQDKNFVKWARQELKDGNKVFYSCSW